MACWPTTSHGCASCLLNTTSLPVLTALYARFGLSNTTNPTADELYVAAKQTFNRGDCVLTQTATSLFSFSTHLGWTYRDNLESKSQFCRKVPMTLTYLTTLPPCIAGLPLGALTADAYLGTNAWMCNVAGSTRRLCNWNASEVNSRLCEAHPPFCGMCFNSTLCREVRGLNQTLCSAAVQCQLQNGTYVTLTGADRPSLIRRCQTLMSCSELCRDPVTQVRRPCENEQQCISLAGRCMEDADLWHYAGTARAPGACLLPITADSPCGITYANYNNTVMTTLSFGCALHTIASPQLCLSMSAPNFVTRWALPATNADECAAHGSTCLRAPLVGFDGRMWPTWSASLTLPPLRNGTSACRLCDGGRCVAYCTWQPGVWRGGSVRPLTWTVAAMSSVAGFEVAAFTIFDFSNVFATAVQSSYANFVISVQQCRYDSLATGTPTHTHTHMHALRTAARSLLKSCSDSTAYCLRLRRLRAL